MGKPTATEDMIRALVIAGPTVQAFNMEGVTIGPEAVRANPSKFCEAVFTVGKVRVKIDLNTTPDRVARKVCHRNGMCLPRAKAAKAYLYAVASQMVTDGHAAMAGTSASELIVKFEANSRRKVNKERRERRLRAEQELRSAMRKWDFSLEEVTKMWYEREVDAVHEH